MKPACFEYKKYSSEYEREFEQMKKSISDLSPRKLVIHHVGSTSVRGLGGKGIIDISIGIGKWSDADDILKILKKLGFKHFHEIENHNLFVSTKALCEEGDFHVHISRIGTKKYVDTLSFRDCLRSHPEISKEYAELKRKIFKECEGDRKVYKAMKHRWFENRISL
jgi:GrpB-like predicted nucleotidyltransferase (UPF0157 family)